MMPTAASTPRLWIDDSSKGSSRRLFAAALAAACIVHLVLLFGVSFELPEADSGKRATRALEIVVLRQAAPTEATREIADALARVDRAGVGIEEVQDTVAQPSIQPVPEILESEPAPVLEPPEPILEPPEPIVEPPPAPPEITAAQILASRNLEIAELTSRIQNSSVAYANRPRRKAISASTREYKYANYLEAWRRKVERVGNLNYPEEAKRHKMYGNLIVHVAVRADGSTERIRVLRSSGFKVLDEAAVKIVELAAPYAPFPPDIRAETDILDITRTWQFLSSNRLGWEN